MTIAILFSLCTGSSSPDTELPPLLMSDLQHQEDSPAPIVYIHVRTLRGVIESHYRPSASQHTASRASVLGDRAAAYLVAHGYTVASIDTIVRIRRRSSRQQFPLELAARGMSLAEATYLHELIDN